MILYVLTVHDADGSLIGEPTVYEDSIVAVRTRDGLRGTVAPEVAVRLTACEVKI